MCYSFDLQSATDRWQLLLLFAIMQYHFDWFFASSVLNSEKSKYFWCLVREVWVTIRSLYLIYLEKVTSDTGFHLHCRILENYNIWGWYSSSHKTHSTSFRRRYADGRVIISQKLSLNIHIKICLYVVVIITSSNVILKKR